MGKLSWIPLNLENIFLFVYLDVIQLTKYVLCSENTDIYEMLNITWVRVVCCALVNQIFLGSECREMKSFITITF